MAPDTTTTENEKNVGTVTTSGNATNDSNVITTPSPVELIKYELQAHMQIALALKAKIDAAKTAPKKNLYRKKLIKNNKKASELILYLEHLQVNRAIRQNKNKQEFIHTRNKENEDGADAGSTTGGRISPESTEA